MLAYLRLEGTRLYRSAAFLVISLISPLFMYLILTGSAASATRVYLTVSVAAFGAIGAVLSNAAGIAEDRGLGWLRMLRLTPLRPAQAVTGRALVTLLVAIPPIVAVQAAGAALHGVHHTPVQWAAATVALWAGVAPMALAAIALGYLFRPQIAQATAVAGYLALSIAGGLWAPVASEPHWLQPLARFTPTYRYTELAYSTATGHAPDLAGAAILAGWLAAAAAFAVLAYRKSAR